MSDDDAGGDPAARDPADPPVALAAYEALADDYAAKAPTKPYNADLERPATRSLLPPVEGLDTLDAGCGPGITTEELHEAGARRVVGADVSPRMLEHARDRVGDRADLVRLDMGRPLPVADDSFDLVHSSLAVTYVREWDALFSEFARVLRPGGVLVFSTQHPFDDATRLEPADYFAVEEVTETWDGFGDPVDVTFFRRPLEVTLNALLGAGFRLEAVEEAKPTERFRERRPDAYDRVRRRPPFLCLRASLPGVPDQ
ncbi:class I SAM-dependent methyltransferase [Halobium salinum]|uniref:Class I SAM-dependent methyltransferase n=1 Tax=Halobium salinum TaxID=1364940 RepID=A0ABD5PFG3_9EURY|nr:class I SAM-dependent methyltransferase [Halobium salinum]